MSVRNLALVAAVFALAAPICVQAQSALEAPAAGQNRVYADSRLVTRGRISVEVAGAGPDVVMIPGLGSSRETFRRTAERLRGRFRLHLVQVAGFAGEPARDNASGPVVAPTVEAIAAYITDAGLTSSAVIGHSLGGVMALELAADHPALVKKAMIVDTLGFYSELFAGPQATVEGARRFAEPMAKAMLAASDADFAKGSAQTVAMMATAPSDRARIQALSVESARPTFVTAMKEDMLTDLRPRMASIRAPVTVIYEAALAPLIQADYAPAPNKTLIAAAPAAKHFITYDDPAGFDAAVDGFLAR